MQKTMLITGSTNGIGRAAAVALARQGHTIVLHGRNTERCQAAIEHVRQLVPDAHPEYLVADLASLAQVRSLAESILERYSRLDVLVNNAGAYFMKRQLSPDGFELTWAVNHLSMFLLTNLLLDLLIKSAPARIVNVSSVAHWNAQANFTNLESRFGFFGWQAYSRSKLANILFTRTLADHLEGSGVTVNALHPGFVASGFAQNNGLLVRLASRLYTRAALSPEQGAETIVYLAGSGEVEHVSGQYFYKCKPVETSPASNDPDAAKHLWKISAQAVGLPEILLNTKNRQADPGYQ